MLLTILSLVAGLAALLVGGELLVRGSAGLALRLGLSPLIVGLTVVALGTSSPELAVSVAASLRGEADVAVGNVVGSNIANILLVLGLAALVRPIRVARQVVRLDAPAMVVASAAVLLLALDGRLGRADGLVLALGLAAYGALLLRAARRGAAAASGSAPPQGVFGRRLLQIAGGLVGLVAGAHWAVAGAVSLARGLGIGELVIGLTVIAIGTSLPELTSSVLASARGEGDLAVGNVVGSNVMNLLCVLAVAAILAPRGIPVLPEVLRLDLPVMIAVALAALPVLCTDLRVTRLEGGLFVAAYAAYVGYLALAATHHRLLAACNRVLAVVLPLLVVAWAVLSLRRWWRHRQTARA